LKSEAATCRKSLTKNFSERLKGGDSVPTPLFRSFERPKALPLETTSFLKKAGQKLLFRCFIYL
ncbi:MAG: hypothetical protein ACI4JM_08210, partial [Oscillospiraceae bacterium]